MHTGEHSLYLNKAMRIHSTTMDPILNDCQKDQGRIFEGIMSKASSSRGSNGGVILIGDFNNLCINYQ